MPTSQASWIVFFSGLPSSIPTVYGASCCCSTSLIPHNLSIYPSIHPSINLPTGRSPATHPTITTNSTAYPIAFLTLPLITALWFISSTSFPYPFFPRTISLKSLSRLSTVIRCLYILTIRSISRVLAVHQRNGDSGRTTYDHAIINDANAHRVRTGH